MRPGFTASRNWWVRFDDRRAWQVTRQSPFVVLLVSCLLFCGLWLTVLPAETVLRWVQLGLGIVVIAGAVLVSRFPLVAVSVTVAATGAGWALGLTADPFVVAGFVVFTYAEQRRRCLAARDGGHAAADGLGDADHRRSPRRAPPDAAHLHPMGAAAPSQPRCRRGRLYRRSSARQSIAAGPRHLPLLG